MILTTIRKNGGSINLTNLLILYQSKSFFVIINRLNIGGGLIEDWYGY